MTTGNPAVLSGAFRANHTLRLPFSGGQFVRWGRNILFTFIFAGLPLLANGNQQVDPRNILRPQAPQWTSVETASAASAYGAEANPTGDPVGGGDGYSRVLTSGDFTVRTYRELRSALQQAEAGQVVFIPGDVRIDFGNRSSVTVPAEVTLASDRGHEGSSGALLFSDELSTNYIIQTGGDYARVTGLRIRGPFDETWRVPISSRGLNINGYGCEVDNIEISAFSSRAIAGGTRSYIHHNFIHHNQRNGLGYGISGGNQLVIEANHFDYNRHDIAASGSPGNSYEARYNLIGRNAISHHFDMHGGRDRGDGTDIAGDWIHIHHNTFLGSGQRPVVIRGVPSQGAWIHHNWIVESSGRTGIIIDGRGHIYDNVIGKDQEPYQP